MTHNGCDVRTHFLADTADRLIAIIISGVLCHLKCYFSVPTKCKYMYDLLETVHHALIVKVCKEFCHLI